MKRVTIYFFLIVLMLEISCSSKSVPAPDWYYNLPESQDHIYVVATAVSKDRQLAVNKASTEGRAELGREIESHLKGLYKNFAEEVGLGEDAELLKMYSEATKIVVDKTLVGSHVEKKEVKKEGDIYRAWVLIKLPLDPVHLGIYSEIKNRENMYTRFRASKAFEEIEEEVKQYREYKKEQMEKLEE
jgi:hypothetical protein